MNNQPITTDIDQYIISFPEPVQKLLQEVRKTIRSAAPDATEAISYQIPTFKLKGNLVHFGAFKKHIGFYPSSSGIRIFQDELTAYVTSKGAIQFPFDKPIPYDLISRITKFRVEETLNKAAEKIKSKAK